MSKKVLSLVIAALTFVLLVIVSDKSFAANGAFLSEMCNVLNVVTGSTGKIIASVGIAAVGVGFFTGKVSWGLLIGASSGVGLMFGAPTMVAALSGTSYYECIQDKTYVTTCVGNECYACPMGYGGENCASCGVGFTGPTCSECAPGYTGENCSQCDVGYSKYEGVCHIDCRLTSVPGIVDSVVSGGVGTKSCDATNFTGSVEYSCLNSTFSITQNNCQCVGNHSGTNCSDCVAGYVGSSCSDCAANYTMVNQACYKDCTVSANGFNAGTSAIPLTGSLTCNDSGYIGAVDYVCEDGVFSVSGGMCMDRNSCNGGEESKKTINGTVYKIHVFKSSGSFSCMVNKNLEYLIIGGGGGGGNATSTSSGGNATSTSSGGGGGAGGFLSGSKQVSAGDAWRITVGSGGSAGSKGNNTYVTDNDQNVIIISYGGGLGAYPDQSASDSSVLNGGSGGGGSNQGSGGSGVAGQGNNGAKGEFGNLNGNGYVSHRGGGGGGAGNTGGGVGGGVGGSGGKGKVSSISGSDVYYSGGGGGGSSQQKVDSNGPCYNSSVSAINGYGGSNIGGKGGMGGSSNFNVNGGNGVEYTGSGGGGGGFCGGSVGSGGSGGSGILIIRYVY